MRFPQITGSGFALVAVLGIAAAATPQSETTGAGVAQAVRVDHTPKIDGTLDDPVWRTAPTVGDFRQREPLETQPATEMTEVLILFDSRHLYFGFHCYDHETVRLVSSHVRTVRLLDS